MGMVESGKECVGRAAKRSVEAGAMVFGWVREVECGGSGPVGLRVSR